MSAPLATAEPVVITVKRYKCPFCPRGHASRKRALEHIARCWHDPAARTCKTCAHLNLYRGGMGCEQGGPGCSCDQDEVTCSAGVDIDFGDIPRLDCPLWALRKDS